MTNDESLSLVKSAIADIEAELGELDSLTARAQASQETIAGLEGDISDLHFNRANLDSKARVSRLTNATALISLERSDLATLNSQIDGRSDYIVQLERRAQSLLQQVWSAVREARKTSVEAMLEINFDLRRLSTFATQFSDAAFSVLELDEIRDTLFHYRYLPIERDLAIHDARASAIAH